MDFVIIAWHGSQCEHFSEPLYRNITEDLLSPGCDFIIFNWCLCSLPGLQQNLLFRLCCQQLFSSREHETSISIAALTMTGSAWCSPATDGSAVEEITNGWCGRLRTATFAAACRISTCCEMSCAQAFRGDCVENHGTLVRAQQRRDTFAIVVMSARMLCTTATFVTGLIAGMTLPRCTPSNLTNWVRWRTGVVRSSMLCQVGLCQKLALQYFRNTLSGRLCRSLEFVHFLLIS